MKLVSTEFRVAFTSRENALWQTAMQREYESCERFEPPHLRRFSDGWIVSTGSHLYLGADDRWHQGEGPHSYERDPPALFASPGDAICRLAWVLRRPPFSRRA